jgi:hypothetical protein
MAVLSQKEARTILRRWGARGVIARPEIMAPPLAPDRAPLSKKMGMQVRTRWVTYRGLYSWQCVLLPVSECCGWSRVA